MDEKELEDMVPAPADEKPILAFLCHPHSKEKAGKTITNLAETMDNQEGKRLLLKLPVKTLKGTPKNILIAASTNDEEVFRLNMKTGESYYE